MGQQHQPRCIAPGTCWLLLLALCGSAISIVADILSAYAPGIPLPSHEWSVSLQTVAPLFAAKSHAEQLAGHYLAAVGIPLEGLGIVVLHRLIAARQRSAAWGFSLLAIPALVLGFMTHTSLGFVGSSIRYAAATGDAGLSSRFIGEIASYYNPVTIGFVSLMTAALALLFALVVSGRTALPRRFAIITPLPLQLALFAIALTLPPSLATGVWTTSYNLSLGLTYLFLAIATQRGLISAE